MHRVWALLLAVAGCTFCSTAHAELSKMVVRRVKAATVYIEVTNTARDGTETGSTGSGFVIDPDGLVLTNQHVIDDRIETGPGKFEDAAGQTIQVSFQRGTTDEVTYDATLVKRHRSADLALLQLPEGTYPTLDVGDSDQVTETQNVYAAGHPLGLAEISLRTGTVTSKRMLDGYPYVEHSVNIQQGNSGGPLFDGDGTVVGVNVFMLRDSAGAIASYAITTKTIADFLADQLPAEASETKGTSRAFLEALLDQAELVYNKLDGGVYELPYEDANVYVSAVEGWVQLQVPLGALEEGTALERYDLYDSLLRANYSYPAGRFGLDGDGDLWLEQYVKQDDVSATTLDLYAGHIATLAQLYVRGDLTAVGSFPPPRGGSEFARGTAARPVVVMASMQTGDSPEAEVDWELTLTELLDAADLAYSEEGDGIYKLPYDNDVSILANHNGDWLVLQSYLGRLGDLSRSERAELYAKLLESNYTHYVGKFGLDQDGDLWVEQDALYLGLSPGAVTTYAAFLSGVAGDYAKGDF